MPQSRSRRRRQGSNAIEFVLCLPIFIVVLSAVFDFGWLLFQQSSLDAAVNLGCRAGSLVDPGEVDENVDMVAERAEEETWEALDLMGGGTCSDCDFSAALEGDFPTRSLHCEVERSFRPLLGFTFGERRIGSSQATRMEWQYDPTGV